MDISGRKHSIDYGSSCITFRLSYRLRKTLDIHVHPDTSVEVVAPLNTPIAEIKKRVERRGRWISKQQQFFASLPPKQPPRQYRSGESLRYLGRQYRLKVVKGRAADVKLKRGELTVTVPDTKDTAKVRSLVQQWYQRRADAVFAERMEYCVNHATKFNIPPPAAVTLRRMKTRWGSCSKQGRITLNTELMQASKDCIDYVILHEICHLVEHNHSSAYYRLLSRVAPDWRGLRKQINSQVSIEFLHYDATNL